MAPINRREFVRLGTGGLALASAGLLPALGRPVAADTVAASLSYDFVVAPGQIAAIDAATGQISRVGSWAVPVAYETLLSDLSTPFLPQAEELANWASQEAEDCGCTAPPAGAVAPDNPLAALRMVTIDNAFDVLDLAGTGVTALVSAGSLDLDLSFRFPAESELGFQPDFSHIGLGQPGVVVAGNPPPPNVTLFGWKFQFRGPDDDPLGWCVRENVRHFNVELMHQNNRGGWDYALNFHLGGYQSGGRRCFVLWENKRFNICWKRCGPTRRDLVDMFKWSLGAAAVAIGVSISGWIIATIAEVAATAVFIPLLLL